MEKNIIEGKLVSIKKIAIIIFAVIAVVACSIVFSWRYSFVVEQVSNWDPEWDWVIEEYGENITPLTVYLKSDGPLEVLSCVIGAALISFLFYIIFNKTELIVTDKRVFGKAAFGKRVDIPLDAISSVGTAFMNTIAVTSASGAIKFSLLKNRDEVHAAISKLIMERQEQKVANTSVTSDSTAPKSNIDDLKKLKELLDSDIITQEEFDAKKKQLLGL